MNKNIPRKIFQLSLDVKLNLIPKFNNLLSLRLEFGFKKTV